jgi:hypothetical protein
MAIDVPLMLDHTRRFVELISRYFPLPAELIARHADRLDWATLSQNSELEWSATLLDSHGECWNWDKLPREALRVGDLDTLIAAARASRLPSSRLTLAIVDRRSFERCLVYFAAEQETSMRRLLELAWPADARDWIAEALVDASIGLRSLSDSEHFPWTAEFIAAHADQLDWWALSTNRGLPWSLELIRAFDSRWRWEWLCSPPRWGLVCEDTPWTAAVLDQFEHRLCWFGGRRSLVDEVVWTPQLFERHRAAIEAAYASGDRFVATSEPGDRFAPGVPHYWTYGTHPEHFTRPLSSICSSSRIGWACRRSIGTSCAPSPSGHGRRSSSLGTESGYPRAHCLRTRRFLGPSTPRRSSQTAESWPSSSSTTRTRCRPNGCSSTARRSIGRCSSATMR